MIVTEIVGVLKDEQITQSDEHKIYLTYLEMSRRRQRLKTDKGLELAIDLPQTQNLEDKAILFTNEDQIIYIEEVPVKSFVLKPQSDIQWGIVGYNIGNMHKPAYLNNEEILVPYDKTLEGVFNKIGISFEVEDRKMVGVRANAEGVVGHHHEA